MAKRIKDLDPITGALTGYTFECDLSTNAETEKVTFEDLVDEIADNIATETTPTYSIPSGSATISSQTNKTAIIGGLIALQIKIAFELSTVTTVVVNHASNIVPGASGQQLHAVVDVGSTPYMCKCVVSGETPMQLTVTRIDGGNFPTGGTITITINGTLLTSL